ncbi:MAG: ABC transporter permease, partial [Chloroflexi bacterium]|nr:ABC transporter permease [Chloroflexota bacterium]
MATASPPPASPSSANWQRIMLRNFLELLPTLLAPIFGIAAALIIIVLILQTQDADPKLAWDYLYQGTLESAEKRADMVAFWMPVAITSFGLVLTYNAGLWNIGVEGQIIMGAIGATWAVRVATNPTSNPYVGLDTPVQISLMFICVMLLVAGLALLWIGDMRWITWTGLLLLGIFFFMALRLGEVFVRDYGVHIAIASFVCAAGGGALWATIAAVLKTRGGVNEIFGGVALNFIAQTFNLYLVDDPWADPGGRSLETTRFPEEARLASFEQYRRLSPATIYITLGAFVLVFLIMTVSRWGLQLRAQGKNERSAYLLGVRTERNTILAMALCGAMAGIAGGYRVHDQTWLRLTSSPSGGIGFLAILIVLLASLS